MSDLNENITYRVGRNDRLGRFLVAAKDLSAGEIIISELPFAYGPKNDSPCLCLGCCAPVDASVKCSACHWPVCGAECEKHISHREAECKVFSTAKVKFQPVQDATEPCAQYECITPLRLLLAKEQNEERWQQEVACMESHDEARKALPVWRVNQINTVDFLRLRCRLEQRFTAEEIHRAIGLLDINAFEGRTAAGHAIRLIYTKLAVMSHNCVSNITHCIHPQWTAEEGSAVEEFRMIARAAIPVSQGEELSSSYTYPLLPTLLRRENLRQSKFFDCQCKRCADPTELGTHMSSLKCTKCEQGLVLSTNPLDQNAGWQCSHCPFSTGGPAIHRLLASIQAELDQLDEAMKVGSGREIEDREALWRKYRRLLHPQHSVLTGLRHTLSQLYGRVEGYLLPHLPHVLLERKVQMCRDLLQVLQVVEPGCTRIRGMTLYELHAPLIWLARGSYQMGACDRAGLRQRLEEAAAALEEAARILGAEPPATPEGLIGRVADQSLAQLNESIRGLDEGLSSE